jgi:hypothetical protein
VDEAPIPLYYTVKPTATDSEINYIVAALKMTPIEYVIVFSPYDVEVARKLAPNVLTAKSRDVAYDIATLEAFFPVAIVSGGDTLAAYYEDGSHFRLI